MAEIYQLPENGNNGNASIPFSIPIGFGGNGWGNGFGNGMNGVFDIFALALVASMFGGNWGNGGVGFGGGNNAAAGYIANQLNNDSGRELLMNAITSQGEAGRQATQNLATMIGQDFNLVNAGVQNIQNALQTLALQQAVSTPQIINSIQSGDASLMSAFQNCCCENRLAICQQTNELQTSIASHDASVRLQLAQNEAADQLSVCQQTNTLLNAINAQTVAMNDQFCALKERELQSKIDTQAEIITQLRNAADNAAQTNQIIGYVNSVVAPLQKSVTEIENKMPNTVPVQWPQLTAVNTTPYVNGGFYGNGWYGSNGFGGNIVF